MRSSPLDLSPEQFRTLGHHLVDQLAELLREMPRGPVTTGADLTDVRDALGRRGMPREGSDPRAVLDHAIELLRAHNLYNGHRSARRADRGDGQSERRRLFAVADGDGDRSADDAVDRRAARHA
jgi:hypothetical protein